MKNKPHKKASSYTLNVYNSDTGLSVSADVPIGFSDKQKRKIVRDLYRITGVALPPSFLTEPLK